LGRDWTKKGEKKSHAVGVEDADDVLHVAVHLFRVEFFEFLEFHPNFFEDRHVVGVLDEFFTAPKRFVFLLFFGEE
jgi:hypothetical protein